MRSLFYLSRVSALVHSQVGCLIYPQDTGIALTLCLSDLLRRHVTLHSRAPEPAPRSQRACDACRVNKTKCSGGDQCSLCAKRETRCTYGRSSSTEPEMENDAPAILVATPASGVSRVPSSSPPADAAASSPASSQVQDVATGSGPSQDSGIETAKAGMQLVLKAIETGTSSMEALLEVSPCRRESLARGLSQDLRGTFPYILAHPSHGYLGYRE